LGIFTMHAVIRGVFCWAALLSLTGCATSTFSGGAFRTYDGLIACEVPGPTLGTWHVRQSSEPGASGVEFVDDFGGMYKVELVDLRALPAGFQTLPLKDQLGTTANGIVFDNIRSVAPQAKMESSAFIHGLLGGAVHSVFWVPGGSPLVEYREGRASRLDSVRSVLVLKKGRYLVTATIIGQHLPKALNPGKPTTIIKADAAKDLPRLIRFAHSIRVGSA
jgi:hypothetical protein